MAKKIEDFNAEDRIDIKLLENNTFFLTGEIDEFNIERCMKWIAFENLDNKQEKLLTLYVNSPGGDLYQAFALIDLMQSSYYTIRTIGIGNVCSAAFLIVSAGTKDYRYVAKNSCIMCHQLSEGIDGKFHDVQSQMKETERSNQRMLDLLVAVTGKAPTYVKKRLLPATDVYMTAEEMIQHGAADHILEGEE